MTQISNSLDKATLLKIGKGALIAGGGALLFYVLNALMLVDFGRYTPIMVAILSILINAVREWRKGE